MGKVHTHVNGIGQKYLNVGKFCSDQVDNWLSEVYAEEKAEQKKRKRQGEKKDGQNSDRKGREKYDGTR